MNLITCTDLRKQYDERKLLDGVTVSLNEGEKVGIIGVNGTGKSTLLKLIYGVEEPDEGTIVKANGILLSYLPQHPAFAEGATVLEAVLSGHRKDEDLTRLTVEAKTMLTKLSVTDFGEQVSHMSGGQRKRLALVRTLLSGAEVLLLDEPTNHLDATMSEWLEQYLGSYRGAMIMVTHDRYFLDSVTNRIVEIDHGKVYSYKTNYSGFLELKAAREQGEDAAAKKRENMLRIELAWMQRGARARSTKQKAHIERYENLAAVKAPEKQAACEISSVSTRLGRTTIEIEHVSKAYGDRCLVKDFTYYFSKGERIGFLGPNGCGKTTLMKMLVGEVVPDSGTIEIGQTVKIGYYAQELSREDTENLSYMDPEKRVIDYIRDTAEYVQTTEGPVSASVMLERFLFPPEKQYARIGKLSGGEKRRLNLLRVLMEAPNVLILDEPTNDLDIETLTILEDYLDRFDGIVLIVSHDRYLMDRLVKRIFAYEGEGVLRQYEGNYTDYWLRKKGEEESSAAAGISKKMDGALSTAAAGTEKKKDVSRLLKRPKFSYAEEREYKTIDADIAALEEGIEKLSAEMEQNASNYGKLQELEAEKAEMERKLEEKMDRWMYLNELAEKIAEYEQK